MVPRLGSKASAMFSRAEGLVAGKSCVHPVASNCQVSPRTLTPSLPPKRKARLRLVSKARSAKYRAGGEAEGVRFRQRWPFQLQRSFCAPLTTPPKTYETARAGSQAIEWELRAAGVVESGVRSVQVAVAPSYSHTS